MNSEDLILQHNPFRGRGLPDDSGLAPGVVSRDPSQPLALLAHCPAASPTPLIDSKVVARTLGVAQVCLKDERQRMGLGSFKALGAAYAIAREAQDRLDLESGTPDSATVASALRDRVFACASAGNHGLSVAAGARVFGAQAVIYLSEAIPEAFARRLQASGARVVRAGEDYEASMTAAQRDADANGWVLLSDSSWPGYMTWPRIVMEGYLVAAAEACDQMDTPPTHIVLQAGVGGFAAAMTALCRARWGDAPTIIVVEPQAAPALMDSIRAGRPVTSSGPVSIMGRLDCKAPSHLALGELAREADWFATLTDTACAQSVSRLANEHLATTPSGAAGIAALLHAGPQREVLGLGTDSRVLGFITEGPEAP